MSTTSGKQNLSKNEKKIIWIRENISRIEALGADDFAACPHELFAELTVFLKSRSKPVENWNSFFRHTNAASLMIEDKTIKHTLLVTHIRFVQSKDTSDAMTHHEKRRLLLNIGLNFKEYSVQDAIVEGNKSMTLPGGTVLKFEHRERDREPIFKLRTTMYDKVIPRNAPDSATVVDEASGFRIVPGSESVLFYSGDYKKFNWTCIELVVYRNVAQTSPDWDASSFDHLLDSVHFYDWIVGVIDYACDVRRDQRPNHPGHMAQAGLTMGARHIPKTARRVGWGKSYSKKLSDESKTVHDGDTIAAAGLLWSIILTTMPTEVTKPVIRTLSDNKVPHMASQYVLPGKGFHLELGGRHIVFPDVNRSPPEIYLTRGYSAWSHRDSCYAPWAFSFTAGRRQCETKTKGISIPSYGGANFVDITLRVVIVNTQATLFAFQPKYPHGTTVTGGTTNFNLTCTFSQKIGDAIAELAGRGNFGDCSWGAGEGNLDYTVREDDNS